MSTRSKKKASVKNDNSQDSAGNTNRANGSAMAAQAATFFFRSKGLNYSISHFRAQFSIKAMGLYTEVPKDYVIVSFTLKIMK